MSHIVLINPGFYRQSILLVLSFQETVFELLLIQARIHRCLQGCFCVLSCLKYCVIRAVFGDKYKLEFPYSDMKKKKRLKNANKKSDSP